MESVDAHNGLARKGLPADGLLAVVKRECPTCELVTPVLRQLQDGPGVVIASQDDPSWPDGHDVVDDTHLNLSWALRTDTTPTLYRFVKGSLVASAEGWHRGQWEEVAEVAGLGTNLPESRPGCGSRIHDPGINAELRRRDSGSKLRSRLVELGSEEDEFEAMYARGWSDGLPLVPPTPSRVETMLTGTSREADEVLGAMPPDLAPCTVEKVAVNAVMAGCLPEYLPTVLAAVEASMTDSFNIHGLSATTYFSGPVVIVNGPVRHQIGMNSGFNALGPGNRANATIGRALNLVVRNVGGAIPGGVDRATLGSPGKYTFCFAEDEEGSDWESLAVERGFASDQSTVTLFAAHGPHEINDQRSRSATSLARSFAAHLHTVSHVKLAGRADAIVVVSPDHARVFGEAGWHKRRLRDEINGILTVPAEQLQRGAGGIEEGLLDPAPGTTISKFGANGLYFVRAGGPAGLFSGILGGWANGPTGSQITTLPIGN